MQKKSKIILAMHGVNKFKNDKGLMVISSVSPLFYKYYSLNVIKRVLSSIV